MKPDQVERLANGEHAVSILGLASFHANGHVREAALRKLSEDTSGLELPFLLIRLNDWVEPVRTLAHEGVQSRLTANYAGHFLKSLHLLLRLEFCGREAHDATVQAVGELLCRPECRPQLLEGVASGDRVMRHACLRFAAEIEGAGRLSILRAALGDTDPLIRLWTARRLLADATMDDLPKLTAELVRDPFMPVRREALQSLAQRLPDLAAPVLLEALTDRHASIRETARFYLGLLGRPDAVSIYRERLNGAVGAQLVGAVLGLGETGTSEDVERIRPLLKSDETRYRKAAIIALARIAPEALIEEFTAALADPMPGVSNEGCTALLQRVHSVEPAALFTLLREDTPEHVKKNALKLTMRLGKWVSLPVLISLSRGESIISSRTRAFLESWLLSPRRDYSRPTEQQMVAAARALAEASPGLDAGLERSLSSLLKEWGAP